MITYANQKEITIHKIVNNRNYLSIDNDDWMDAFKKLKPKTFGVFLYLARISTDKTNWALSSADVVAKLGISRSSYYRAIDELMEKGYVCQNETGTYDVYINLEYHKDIVSQIETDSPTDETTECPVDETIDCLNLRQSHPRDNSVSPMTQECLTDEYRTIKNDNINDKNMGEVIPQTPSKANVNKEIVYQTRDQVNLILHRMKENNVEWKITNNMYETPTKFIRVIGEDVLEEKKPEPIGEDIFEFI